MAPFEVLEDARGPGSPPPPRPQGLLEPVVLGQFKGDVRPNRAFNASGHDWVKLISGAAIGIERGLGSGPLRPCESREAAGLSPAGGPGCKGQPRPSLPGSRAGCDGLR